MEELERAGPAVAAAGTPWRCRFCGTANGPAVGHCRSCGAASDAAATAVAEAPVAEPAPKPAGRARRAWTLSAIALGAAALGALTVQLARRPGSEAVTVTGFEWERSVEIQDHETVREESWRD